MVLNDLSRAKSRLGRDVDILGAAQPYLTGPNKTVRASLAFVASRWSFFAHLGAFC